MRVQKISEARRLALRRKSPYGMPDNPTQRGMRPDEIRRLMAGFVLDETDSVIAEINRIVAEMNGALGEVENEVAEEMRERLRDYTEELNSKFAEVDTIMKKLTALKEYVESLSPNLWTPRMAAAILAVSTAALALAGCCAYSKSDVKGHELQTMANAVTELTTVLSGKVPEVPDVPGTDEPGTDEPGEEKTLVSVSVALSQEDVPVGTTRDELIGMMTVTAHYSDGSEAVVDNYVLKYAGEFDYEDGYFVVGVVPNGFEVSYTEGGITKCVEFSINAVIDPEGPGTGGEGESVAISATLKVYHYNYISAVDTPGGVKHKSTSGSDYLPAASFSNPLAKKPVRFTVERSKEVQGATSGNIICDAEYILSNGVWTGVGRNASGATVTVTFNDDDSFWTMEDGKCVGENLLPAGKVGSATYFYGKWIGSTYKDEAWDVFTFYTE